MGSWQIWYQIKATVKPEWKAPYNYGSNVHCLVLRSVWSATNKSGQDWAFQNLTNKSGQEWESLRSGWDMTRTFVWAPYGQEMGSWALWSQTGLSPGASLQDCPPPPSAVVSYGTENSKVSNVSKTMFGRPSCLPGSCVQSFSPLTVRVSL